MKQCMNELNEREEFEGLLNDFSEIMSHDDEGIKDNKMPYFSLWYRFHNKKQNQFLFITRDSDKGFTTQFLSLEKGEFPKIVARGKFLDAQDSLGNVVHVEFQHENSTSSMAMYEIINNIK